MALYTRMRGSAMASWLVRSTPDRAVRVQAGPGWGYCVVFLGKTLYSHTASLQPCVKIATSEVNAGGGPAMDKHSIQGGGTRNISSRFMLQKRESSSGLMSHLAPVCRLYLYLTLG